MPRIAYPYLPFRLPVTEAHPQGSIAFRPVALASIKVANGQSRRFVVMPDTGADICLFPLSVALALNLDVEKLPKALVSGVGSETNLTYYDTVTIDLGRGIEFTAYAGFTEGMNPLVAGLLGQAGFFDRYNVEFRHSEKAYYIEEASS